MYPYRTVLRFRPASSHSVSVTKKLAHDIQAHRSSPLIPFFFLLTKNSLNTPHLTLSLNQDFFLPLYAPWYLQFTFLFQKNDVISNDPPLCRHNTGQNVILSVNFKSLQIVTGVPKPRGNACHTISLQQELR